MADQEEYATADDLDEELERAFEAPSREALSSQQSAKPVLFGSGTARPNQKRDPSENLVLNGGQEGLQPVSLSQNGLNKLTQAVATPFPRPDQIGLHVETTSFETSSDTRELGSFYNHTTAPESNDGAFHHDPSWLGVTSPGLGSATRAGTWGYGLSSPGLAAREPPGAHISFQFPDWGVDFGKSPGLALLSNRPVRGGGGMQDGKTVREGDNIDSVGQESGFEDNSVLGTKSGTEGNTAGVGSPVETSTSARKGQALKPEEDPSIPASVCVFHTLPEEVLLSIFQKLRTVKDVCSCILVCNKWEEILGGDEIWARLLEQRLPGREFLPGGARAEYKRGVMVRSIGDRFQVLRKGFEYLAAAFDVWWESGPPSDPALPYNQPTVRRIIGKLTASNWALLYEGFAALFIAQADKLAIRLLDFLATAQVAPPQGTRRVSPTPPIQGPSFVLSSPTNSPQPNIKSFPLTRSTAADVMPKTADVSKRTALPPPLVKSPESSMSVSGSFSDDLIAAAARGKRRKNGFGPATRVLTNHAVPLGELVARAESEPEGRGWGRGLRGLAEAGVKPDDVAEALAGRGEAYGLEDEGVRWGDSVGASMMQKSADLSRSNARAGTASVTKVVRRSSSRAGPVGAALWREVLGAWARHRAFVLAVSEQCERLNGEVARERARAHAAAATPTVFDQGALCFRGQILLRHRLRRPLQAGLAWLTMRAVSGDATDDEYELLKRIRHMRQEIDVSDDFTLTKATFTQAKFRRCFCNV